MWNRETEREREREKENRKWIREEYLKKFN